jgi:PEGA domain
MMDAAAGVHRGPGQHGDGVAAGGARNLFLRVERGRESMRRLEPEGGIRLRRNADMKLEGAFALMMCGLGMAACSSMPGFDSLKPKPTTTVLLIQSNPAGAEARSSLGGTCRTPCTMAIGTAGDFTISFARDGYEPKTVTVHSTMSEGGYMTAPSPVLDPNSVYVALEALPQTAPKQAARQRPQPPAAASRVQP